MRRIGETIRYLLSPRTCQHKGRVFNFCRKEDKLQVTEVVLGERVEFLRVERTVWTNFTHMACCSFGDRILVLAGCSFLDDREDEYGEETELTEEYSDKRECPASPPARPTSPAEGAGAVQGHEAIADTSQADKEDGSGSSETSQTVYDAHQIFAALISVDDGSLSPESLHITPLSVSGVSEWFELPYLCHVSANRALLFFGAAEDCMWYCDVEDNSMHVRELATQAPVDKGYNTLPLRLSDGQLLVVGAEPASSDITLISCGDELQFEKVGEIPGLPGSMISSVLIHNRFMAGFGGRGKSDLWIFDIQTRRSSVVWETDAWLPSAMLPTMVLKQDTLYILSDTIYAITLQELSKVIDDQEIRNAFCDVLHFPRPQQCVLPSRDPDPPSGTISFQHSLPGTLGRAVFHKGRLLYVSIKAGKLVVSELIFPNKSKYWIDVYISVFPALSDKSWFTPVCCSFGDRILILGSLSFAILVSVDDGRLSGDTVSAVTLDIISEEADSDWQYQGCLTQISDNRLLLHSVGSLDESAFYCDLLDGQVIVTRPNTSSPQRFKFASRAISLPDGKLLAAGEYVGVDRHNWDIALISCDRKLIVEKIGSIPGYKRCCPFIILVAERFVLGFGGSTSRTAELSDFWIFDLQTRRSSVVWEKSMWVPSCSNTFVFLKENRLYIVARDIHIIPLQEISELIDDDEIRAAFCKAFNFPSVPKYRLPPVVQSLSGMAELTGCLPITSFDTVEHRGRIFHFSIHAGQLAISEVMLYGRHTKLLTLQTTAVRGSGKICCCSLGSRILLMCKKVIKTSSDSFFEESETSNDNPITEDDTNNTFAAFVTVAEGTLSPETVCISQLVVDGEKDWPSRPHLCPISENRALLYSETKGNCYCDVVGPYLLVRKCDMPHSFSLPLCLPDGRLLVTEEMGWPLGVFLRLSSVKIAYACRAMPASSQLLLVLDRFVIGFAGGDAEYFWIFDLHTHKSSGVSKKGKCHAGDKAVFFLVRDGCLYLLGGKRSKRGYVISFSAFSDLIWDETIRLAFKSALSPVLPLRPSSDELLASIPLLQHNLYLANSEIDALKRSLAQERSRVSQLSARLSELQKAASSKQLKGELAGPKITPSGPHTKPKQLAPRRLSRIFPVLSVPLTFSRLQRLCIDIKKLKELSTMMKAHSISLPRDSAFRRDYVEVFGSLLAMRLPRKLLSAEASALDKTLRSTATLQLSRLSHQGYAFAPDTLLAASTKTALPRPQEKLLDSAVLRRTATIAGKVQQQSGRRANRGLLNPGSLITLPSYYIALSLLNTNDPLLTDTVHRSLCTLRRTIRNGREGRTAPHSPPQQESSGCRSPTAHLSALEPTNLKSDRPCSAARPILTMQRPGNGRTGAHQRASQAQHLTTKSDQLPCATAEMEKPEKPKH